MSAPIAAAVSPRARSGQRKNGGPNARSPIGPPQQSAWACLTAARRSLHSFARSRRLRPSAANRGLSHRRSLRAYLRFADIVDIVDVVAEIGRPVAIRPAGQIDPNYRHGLREVDVVARAFLDFSLQRSFVPAAGRPSGRPFQQPRRVIVNALHPDTSVA